MRPWRWSPVSRALERDDFGAGGEPLLQLGQGQHQLPVDQAVDAQPPARRVEVRKGSVVAAAEGVDRFLVVDDHVVPLPHMSAPSLGPD
jgi:hypothetical protein